MFYDMILLPRNILHKQVKILICYDYEKHSYFLVYRLNIQVKF